MKVAYVLKRYPRYSETFIVNEILAHEATGLEIEIFALRPPTDPHFQDAISRVRAPVTYVAYSGVRAPDFWSTMDEVSDVLPGLFENLKWAKGEEGRDVYQAIEVAKLVKECGVEHIHAHFGTSATSVARMASKFAGVPYTFTAHAKDIFHESVEREDLSRKLREAAATVTVSDYNMAYLQDEYGKDSDSAVKVYNGLDLEKFSYRERSVSDVSHVVAVGRFVEKKGFGDLLRAAAILKERGSGMKFTIVGSGELEGELMTQRTRLGLEDTVSMPGPMPQRDVVDLVGGATIFAAPCVVGEDGNRDGLPTVLLEAMALGTPCVSTSVTGIPEVVRHGETGIIVPQHNPESLADALEELDANPAIGEIYSRKSRKLIESDFDIARNTEKLRGIFKRAGAVVEGAA